MHVTRLRGSTLRFVSLFALISLLAVGLITGSVLLLDREARRSRAEEAAQRDLGLIAGKLKGALSDPEAGPLIAGIVRDVDAYAGVAKGRTMHFAAHSGKGDAASQLDPSADPTNRVGVSLRAPAGVLTVYHQIETNDPLRPTFIRYGGFAAALAMTFAVAAGLLVSRWLTSRAAAMNAVFAAVAAGASGQRIGATEGPIEFRTLAGNLNLMLDTIERRVADLRVSSDRIAHDLRTPLARIATRLNTIEASDDPVVREAAGTARSEVDTLIGTLNALLDLREIETESTLKREPVRFDLAVREAIDLYEAEAEDVYGVDLIADVAPLSIVGSRLLIVRAAANLVDNALRAAPRRSTVSIRLYQIEGSAGLEVQDSGPGFPATLSHDLGSVGPLRSQWNGHGLGLTIVRAIAERHAGTIELVRRGAATVAVLTIPNT